MEEENQEELANTDLTKMAVKAEIYPKFYRNFTRVHWKTDGPCIPSTT